MKCLIVKAFDTNSLNKCILCCLSKSLKYLYNNIIFYCIKILEQWHVGTTYGLGEIFCL